MDHKKRSALQGNARVTHRTQNITGQTQRQNHISKPQERPGRFSAIPQPLALQPSTLDEPSSLYGRPVVTVTFTITATVQDSFRDLAATTVRGQVLTNPTSHALTLQTPKQFNSIIGQNHILIRQLDSTHYNFANILRLDNIENFQEAFPLETLQPRQVKSKNHRSSLQIYSRFQLTQSLGNVTKGHFYQGHHPHSGKHPSQGESAHLERTNSAAEVQPDSNHQEAYH